MDLDRRKTAEAGRARPDFQLLGSRPDPDGERNRLTGLRGGRGPGIHAGLGIAVARPIIKTRQKRQTVVLLIIALLAAANLMFYLGAAGVLDQGVRLGIYSGLYLVLGMVLFMGRRVIPFFTERRRGLPG